MELQACTLHPTRVGCLASCCGPNELLGRADSPLTSVVSYHPTLEKVLTLVPGPWKQQVSLGFEQWEKLSVSWEEGCGGYEQVLQERERVAECYRLLGAQKPHPNGTQWNLTASRIHS